MAARRARACDTSGDVRGAPLASASRSSRRLKASAACVTCCRSRPPPPDEFGQRPQIALDAPKAARRLASAVFAGGHGPAEAGADRIDEDEIGEAQPGVRVVDQARGRFGHRAVVVQRQAPGPERGHVQPCSARARTAVEDEGEGAPRGILAVLVVTDVKHIGFGVVLVLPDPHRPRRSGVLELTAFDCERVSRLHARVGRGRYPRRGRWRRRGRWLRWRSVPCDGVRAAHDERGGDRRAEPAAPDARCHIPLLRLALVRDPAAFRTYHAHLATPASAEVDKRSGTSTMHGARDSGRGLTTRGAKTPRHAGCPELPTPLASPLPASARNRLRGERKHRCQPQPHAEMR